MGASGEVKSASAAALTSHTLLAMSKSRTIKANGFS